MATLHLEDKIAAALKAEAEAEGLSVEAYLQRLLDGGRSTVGLSMNSNGAREFDAALDELFASDTRPLPAVALTYSRQDIYGDHD